MGAAKIVHGIHYDGWESILGVALLLGLLNLYVRPLLLLLSLPITILTLGLFVIVINAGLLLLASWIAEQLDWFNFKVDSLGDALLGAIVISLFGMIIGRILHPEGLARELTRPG